MARDYFRAHHKYLRSLRKLSDAECGRLFRALLQYSAGEVDTLIKLQGREEIAFDMICEDIDSDIEAYEEKRKQLSLNAASRWNKADMQMDANASEKCNCMQMDANAPKEKIKEKEKDTPPISPQGDGARVAPQAKPKQRRTSVKPEKRPYGSFGNVMLTDDEHAKLTPAELGLIEELSCYIESSGKKYASHYATLLNWARRRGEEARGKTRHGEDDHVNDSFTDADIESVVEVL